MSRGGESQLSGRLFLCLIGALLLLAGGVFEWLLWRSYKNAVATRAWPEVEAAIIRAEVVERQFLGSPAEYSASVSYRFEFEGSSHESSRLSPRGTKWSKKLSGVTEQLADFPLGSAHPAWVNPEDVSMSILRHDTKAAGYTLWFPALIMVGGAGIVASAFRKW